MPRKAPQPEKPKQNPETPKTTKVKEMKEINLNHAISGQYKLTAEDIENLLRLLTSRCNHRTKYAVRSTLEQITDQKPCGIYERVVRVPKIGRWQYVAGQDYPSEIATVRSLLRGW